MIQIQNEMCLKEETNWIVLNWIEVLNRTCYENISELYSLLFRIRMKDGIENINKREWALPWNKVNIPEEVLWFSILVGTLGNSSTPFLSLNLMITLVFQLFSSISNLTMKVNSSFVKLSGHAMILNANSNNSNKYIKS